ncbi:MAG TPA: AraC family transcriptional regulator, partial [Burkholderiaceae bacterium]|nr:AraC family transcriptional regulator [Burkholderiaceae bacterium]
MDLLTSLFREAGLQRRRLDLRQLSPRTALHFPCAKSLGLHVVTQGQVFVHAPTLQAPLELNAGDIAVMGRGCEHVLATRAKWKKGEVETVGCTWADPVAADDGADASVPAVISGAYQLWNEPVHPFFAELPPWYVVRAERRASLGPLPLTLALLDDEVRRRDLGAETVVHGLLDVVFAFLLRAIVAERGAAGASWSQAVHDPSVRRAVVAMHDDCARAWTLEDLAQHAGLSRTSLAERFRAAMDDTPLAYLRTVRMQRAMHLLADTEHHLERIAGEVGYQDAFSFSKVFKRTTGVSPREFRRRDAA